MALINPHMAFNGNAEEAFHFYQSVFGSEFAPAIRSVPHALGLLA